MPEPTRGSQLSLSDSVSRRGSQASLRSSVSNDSAGSSESNRAETPKITMGGLEVVFLEPLDKKYECVMCTQVLRYPVQFESCGHYCCSSCLSELCRWVLTTPHPTQFNNYLPTPPAQHPSAQHHHPNTLHHTHTTRSPCASDALNLVKHVIVWKIKLSILHIAPLSLHLL